MLVLDASATVDLLLRTPRGGRVATRLQGADVCAPELLDVEVCSALARLQRAGEVAAADAGDAVRRLVGMPADRIPHALLVARAWQLRNRVRVADAFYVGCAELMSAALITADARLARAALPGVVITLVQ